MAPWLFIMPSRIGDAVLTTGIIEWVRQTKKNAEIVIACSSLVRPLFNDLPELKEIIPFETKNYDLHWLELWQLIRQRRWQGIVDFRGSLVSLFVRSKKRYIKTSNKRVAKKCHRVEELARLIDKKTTRDIFPPTLWIAPQRLALAEKLLGGRPTLAVAPTANWAGKQWPVEHFQTVIKTFLDTHQGTQVAIFAAPHEKKQVLSLFKNLRDYPVLDLIRPDLDLLTIAACIKQCKLFSGNDSGLMHISVAVNTPTIGLFGPSDETVYGPWSSLRPSPHTVIRGMSDLGSLEARPGFSYDAEGVCYMNEIEPEKVIDVIFQKWQGERVSNQGTAMYS